jgi:hypothetical protein
MRLLTLAARYVFGALMLTNGLNHFLEFFPLPAMGPASQAFYDALVVSGLFDVVKVLEVVIGILLLTNLFVPAAITVAMPIMVVSTYFNFFLLGGRPGLMAGLLGIGLNLIGMIGYRQYFIPLLTIRSRPASPGAFSAWRAAWAPTADD